MFKLYFFMTGLSIKVKERSCHGPCIIREKKQTNQTKIITPILSFMTKYES